MTALCVSVSIDPKGLEQKKKEERTNKDNDEGDEKKQTLQNQELYTAVRQKKKGGQVTKKNKTK